MHSAYFIRQNCHEALHEASLRWQMCADVYELRMEREN